MVIKLWMVFEALGPDKEGVKRSMEEHIEALENQEDQVKVNEVKQDDIKEMEDPHPGLDKGFSKVVEMKAEIENFTKAISIVKNYGPTYVQIEGPDNYEINLKELQESLQEVADTVHQYAQQGVGGVLISNPTEEDS